MEKSNSAKTRGFLLLEVMIAMAILGVAVAVILQSLSYCARITGLTSSMAEAVLLGRDKLQELEFAQANNALIAGTVNTAKEKFFCDYSLTEIDQAPKFYKLNLEIYWNKRGQRQEIVLNSYLKSFK